MVGLAFQMVGSAFQVVGLALRWSRQLFIGMVRSAFGMVGSALPTISSTFMCRDLGINLALIEFLFGMVYFFWQWSDY